MSVIIYLLSICEELRRIKFQFSLPLSLSLPLLPGIQTDLDPLPSPDVPEHYVRAPNAFTKVGINVTNELGQVRILEVR